MSKAVIEAYFRACSGGSAADVVACFTDDAVVYDTNHEPVRGAETIGVFWSKIRVKWTDARWTVDSYVGNEDTAAIEWSMHGIHEGDPFIVRGSEHYTFTDQKISEIRQYWTFDPDAPGSALKGYSYAE